MYDFKISGTVEKFIKGPSWHYVKLPTDMTTSLFGEGFKAFIPIIVKVGNSEWKTSLLPIGDGKTYFIALKADIRKKEKIYENDNIEIKFSIL